MTTIIEALLSTTEEGRRELARQDLLVSVSDQIWGALENKRMTCMELAQSLGTSASNVSQLLSGRRNMTLGTLADIVYVLGFQPEVSLRQIETTAVPEKHGWTTTVQADRFTVDFNSPQTGRFNPDQPMVWFTANDSAYHADEPVAA